MDEPDPAAQDVLDAAQERAMPPTQGLAVESARERLEELFAERPVEDVAATEEFSFAGPDGPVPVRIYTPSTAPPHPVTLFFHGGGWTVGSLDTHDNVCAALTNRADCLVVSVDYRLAPEDRFPAALEDCYAALEWVHEFGTKLTADPDRIAVAGDSAGGNLAAGVALMARDLDGPTIAHQGLVYPSVGSHVVHDFDSYAENAEGYLLETAGSEWYREQYVPSPVHARNEYFAPLLAADLAGLPPATVTTAGFDILRDEGAAYAAALEAAGVDIEHDHYEGMIHGFVSLYDVLPQGETAIETLADRLAADLR